MVADFVEFLERGKDFTLGFLLCLLELSLAPHESILRDFNDWLNKHHPCLRADLGPLRKVSQFRKREAHSGAGRAEDIPRSCRRILESLGPQQTG